MPKTQIATILLVFLAAAPVAGIAIWSIGRTVKELADPCATWDYPAGRPINIHVDAHDVCRGRSVHTESKARATTRAALVPGILLAAALLAVAAAALWRRRLLIAAGIAMLIETTVVFTIAPLTLIVGVSFLLLARRMHSTP